MEDRARRVLRANLAKIKESKCDPVWLAEELFAAGIVGEEERLAAKDETVSKEHRRDELLDLVVGNGGESVFQTFVNILSSKRHMHWLAMDLKGLDAAVLVMRFFCLLGSKKGRGTGMTACL